MQKKKYPLFPAVKEPFFYGNIISGRSLGDVVYLASRKKYCFRLQLVFESGDVRTVQRTSSDKQTARMERDLALMHIAGELSSLFLIQSGNSTNTGFIII